MLYHVRDVTFNRNLEFRFIKDLFTSTSRHVTINVSQCCVFILYVSRSITLSSVSSVILIDDLQSSTLCWRGGVSWLYTVVMSLDFSFVEINRQYLLQNMCNFE